MSSNIANDQRLGCERLGKILFLQLDPTLRSLLTVLQQHQESWDNKSRHKNADHNLGPIIGISNPSLQQEDEERFLGLYRAEVDLLNDVQETLRAFPNNPLVKEEMRSYRLSREHLTESIAILMDYISLPLVAILRRPTTTLGCPVDNCSTDNNQMIMADGRMAQDVAARRRIHIRQGAERKSIAVTAQTLKLCLEMMTDEGSNNTNLSKTKLIQLVLACSSSLPTGRDITEQSTSTFHEIGIDRGEVHIESLLNVLSQLLLLGSADTAISNQTADFGNELAVAIDGTLLAHLADVCVSVVAPPSQFSETTVLVALRAYQNLLEAAPDPSVWRALFPGCFAGFFRTIISGLRGSASSTPQSRPQVIQLTLQAFNGLLRLTLGGITARTEERMTKRTLADLQRIARSEGGGVSGATKNAGASAGTTDHRKILGDSTASNRSQQQQTSATLADAEIHPNERFLSEINGRLPGPLSLLVKLLRTAQSHLIRRDAVRLCKLLLIQTRSSWDKEVLQDLIILSLESCLILSGDDDEGVVALSTSVLEEYSATASSKNDMNRYLSPRLLSMIEELPALAQRNSELELTNQLKLISAFLALNNNLGVESRKRKPCKTLQSTLAAEGVFLNLRRAIAKLFDVDFRFPSQAAPIEIVDQGSLLLDSRPYSMSNKPFRYMFLAADSEKAAHRVIHELARSLGPKHTSILVDGVVADLFNDCVGRVERGTSRTGRSQVAWCHEWIGCLTLVRELLNGAFTFIDEHGDVRIVKKVKYLNSLAASILPILLSSPLYDLPLNVAQPLGHERDQLPNWNKSRALIESSDSFSPMALRGNACFICRINMIIDTMCFLLQRDATQLVSIVLPPLLQMATTPRVAYVKDSARASLESISGTLGFGTLGNMIGENMSIVSGSILATLRLPGGRSSFPVEAVADEMFEVASSLRAVLELALHHGSNRLTEVAATPLPGSDKSTLSYIIELVATLTERYDCLASKSTYDSETSLAMVRVYEPTFGLLSVAYRAEELEAQQSCKRSPSSEVHPFVLEHLNTFRKIEADQAHNIDETVVNSPREGFEAYHNERSSDHTPLMKEEANAHIVSNQEIVFVSMLLSRLTFFLSNSSLRLQLASCTAMASGFQFLAIVALISKDPDDSARTAIRRQVNDSWPPIEARLVSLTREIQVSRLGTMVVVRQVGAPVTSRKEIDVSTSRVFLSKLFDLVAIMAQCSEDFIASRFKNDVFPLLSKLLADFAAGDPSSTATLEGAGDSHIDAPSTALARGSGHSRNKKRNSHRQASETSLIVSMLRCLAGVFGQPKCGQALRDLIPAAGNLILSFLDDDASSSSSESIVCTACIAAIQEMVQIDCDALFRPLMLLSGKTFPPPKPWVSSKHSSGSTDEEATNDKTQTTLTIVAQRAESLLEFIANLPEQPLL